MPCSAPATASLPGANCNGPVCALPPSARAGVAAEIWHPAQHGRWDAEGRWLLDLPYADPRELVMDILRHVPDVEVLAPQELEDEVRRRLQAGLRQMGGLAGDLDE